MTACRHAIASEVSQIQGHQRGGVASNVLRAQPPASGRVTTSFKLANCLCLLSGVSRAAYESCLKLVRSTKPVAEQ